MSPSHCFIKTHLHNTVQAVPCPLSWRLTGGAELAGAPQLTQISGLWYSAPSRSWPKLLSHPELAYLACSHWPMTRIASKSDLNLAYIHLRYYLEHPGPQGSDFSRWFSIFTCPTLLLLALVCLACGPPRGPKIYPQVLSSGDYTQSLCLASHALPPRSCTITQNLVATCRYSTPTPRGLTQHLSHPGLCIHSLTCTNKFLGQ